MNRLRLLVLPVVLSLAMACSGGGNGETEDEPPAPRPTATSAAAGPTLPPFPTQAPKPTATPVATHEPGTRTGIEVIDNVLAALEAGDASALMQQLSFHPYRCDNAPAGTVGSNPCPPAVPEGSAVDVVAAGGCEVQFLARQRANLEAEVSRFAQAVAGQGLYAVVQVQEGRLFSPLPLRYLIILSGGYSLLLDESGVTHMGVPCDDVGSADLYHPADEDILPPQ